MIDEASMDVQRTYTVWTRGDGREATWACNDCGAKGRVDESHALARNAGLVASRAFKEHKCSGTARRLAT